VQLGVPCTGAANTGPRQPSKRRQGSLHGPRQVWGLLHALRTRHHRGRRQWQRCCRSTCTLDAVQAACHVVSEKEEGGQGQGCGKGCPSHHKDSQQPGCVSPWFGSLGLFPSPLLCVKERRGLGRINAWLLRLYWMGSPRGRAVQCQPLSHESRLARESEFPSPEKSQHRKSKLFVRLEFLRKLGGEPPHPREGASSGAPWSGSQPC
jgi:hypothetical protein